MTSALLFLATPPGCPALWPAWSCRLQPLSDIRVKTSPP